MNDEDSQFGPARGAPQGSNALSHQASGLFGRASVHRKATCPVPVVVDHRELGSSPAQDLSLQSHSRPGGPEAHLHPDILSSLQGRLKRTTSAENIPGSGRVRGQAPAPLLPGSPQRYAVHPRVDVSRAVPVPDEVLHPRSVHLENLSPGGEQLPVPHELLGSDARAVDHDVVLAVQLPQVCNFAGAQLDTVCSQPEKQTNKKKNRSEVERNLLDPCVIIVHIE